MGLGNGWTRADEGPVMQENVGRQGKGLNQVLDAATLERPDGLLNVEDRRGRVSAPQGGCSHIGPSRSKWASGRGLLDRGYQEHARLVPKRRAQGKNRSWGPRRLP